METKEKKENRRGRNPNSLANLKPPIKPGEVRNPLGINRGRIISDNHEQLAGEVIPESLRLKVNQKLGEDFLKQGDKFARLYAIRTAMQVISDGDIAAVREIREAIEGKAKQRVEVTGAEGAALMPSGFSVDGLSDEDLRRKREEFEKVINRAKKQNEDSDAE
jgi:hypothetical protein